MASFRQASADDSGVDAHPVEFVRVVASLIPRELEATITPVTERMSDAQLEAIIARGIEGGLDPAATDQDAQIIQ
jgi:hypothetical protein